ncbi:MAG: diguanylate cyclase [Bacilli bacterium]|jgi:diguanylate cyclase (GGDEF)-like protein
MAMLSIYNFQTNLYSLIILLIVYISLATNKDYHIRESRSFKRLIGLASYLLFAEIMIGISASYVNQVAIISHYFFNATGFIALPAAALMWVHYILREANYDFKKHRLIVYGMMVPIFITGILAFISVFTGWYFTISTANEYIRGPLFFVHIIFSYFYIFLGVAVVLWQRRNLAKSALVPMLLFALPPLVAGILQTLFYGTLIVNPALALSVLMIFLFIQSQRVYTDYLTGLNNRRQFERYVATIKPKSAHMNLAGMLIDLDDFKKINDTYGHFIGDEVLMAMSKILTDTFSPNDFLARVGGDEFFVFFHVDKNKTITKISQVFIENLNAFNQTQAFSFEIKCSYGVDLFDYGTYKSLPRFMASVDQLMYRQKHRV